MTNSTIRTSRARRRLTAAAAFVLAVGLTACGSDDTTDTSTAETTIAPAQTSTTKNTSTTTTVLRPSQDRDGIVQTDHGSMRLRCVGEGASTVVLIAGWGDAGDSWGTIEPALAEQTRVCSYARLGTGTSDTPVSTQTFVTLASDLGALLETAGEPGPYVVLGHSFGGAAAVTFATQHPNDVRGLLLLDASPVTWPGAICAVTDDGTEAAAALQGLCAQMKDPDLHPERIDVFAAFAEAATIDSLGDVPVAVISAESRTAPGLGEAELARLNGVWADGSMLWAALSSNSNVMTVPDAGHYIHLDQPDLVIDELLALLPSPS